MKTEKALRWASIVALLIAGFVFIYESYKFFNMKAEHPELPDKIYAVAILSLVIGIIEIAVAIGHFWM